MFVIFVLVYAYCLQTTDIIPCVVRACVCVCLHLLIYRLFIHYILQDTHIKSHLFLFLGCTANSYVFT